MKANGNRECLVAWRISLGTLVVLIAVGAPRPSQAAVVGSWDLARGGIGSVAESPTNALLKALIETNFPGTTFASSSTLTPEFLAGVDILLLGAQFADSPNADFVDPLSAAEQQALLNFVKTGGGAYLGLERDPQGGTGGAAARESFIDPFGMNITGDLLATTANITDPAHPLVDGPFGAGPNSISLNGAGHFDDLGPYADPLATASPGGQVVLAVIEHCRIKRGSGPVVILGDSSALGTQPYVPQLALNTVAFLLSDHDPDTCLPEPSTWVLGLLGMAGIVANHLRSRTR